MINSDNYIFRKIGGGAWEQLPGFGTDISIGAEGSVFLVAKGIEPGGRAIYKWNGSSWNKFGGAGVRIAVDPAGNPWMINSDNYIFRKIGGGAWEQLPGFGTDISIGAEGSVFLLGKKNVPGGHEVYEWNGSGWTKLEGATGVKITVDPSGNPWIVDSNNYIQRYK